MKKLILLLSILACIQNLFATHISGGEIRYRYLSNGLYEIEMVLHRECSMGSALYDDTAFVFAYNSSDQPVDTFMMLPIQIDTLEFQLSCFSISSICQERALYRDTINIDDPLPLILLYQRCCLVGTLVNVQLPLETGISVMTTIPDLSVGYNSSPTYNSPPPFVNFVNMPLVYDMSVDDTDGDSISYSICEAYIGASPNSPQPGQPFEIVAPTPANAVSVPYESGYSANYPIDAIPMYSIDQNGVLTGTPIVQGVYWIAICISEFRNGILINTARRHFAHHVTHCEIETVELLPQNEVICDGNWFTLEANPCFSAFEWSTGDTTSSIEISEQGNYAVTATDIAGCAVTDDFELTLIESPYIYFTAIQGGLYTVTIDSVFTNTLSTEWDYDDNGTVDFVTQGNDLPPSCNYGMPGIYTITAEAYNECGSFIHHFYIEILQGINEANPNFLLISPNPTTTQLNIESLQRPISSITIHDLLGREIFSKEFNAAQCQINITNWNSGVYLVKIKTDEGEVVKKVAKN